MVLGRNGNLDPDVSDQTQERVQVPKNDLGVDVVVPCLGFAGDVFLEVSPRIELVAHILVQSPTREIGAAER